MFHFTYRLNLKEDPRYYYYGKHSTNSISDRYTGSGTTVKEFKKEKGRDCFNLTILNFFSTSEEALSEEEKLVGDLWKTDPYCLNRYPGGNWKGRLDVTGTVTVWKENKERRIPIGSLEKFQKAGWQRGRSPKAKIRHAEKKICMTIENRKTYVTTDQVEKYLQKGYEIGGYKFTEEVKKRLSDSHRGKFSASLGRITVNRDGKVRHIKEEAVAEYLEQGWSVGSGRRSGRYLTAKDGHPLNFGKVCINNGFRNFYCYPEDLEKYLVEGWSKGRTKKSIETQRYRQALFRESGTSKKKLKEEKQQGIFRNIE